MLHRMSDVMRMVTIVFNLVTVVAPFSTCKQIT
jgi:hypothetical protein